MKLQLIIIGVEILIMSTLVYVVPEILFNYSLKHLENLYYFHRQFLQRMRIIGGHVTENDTTVDYPEFTGIHRITCDRVSGIHRNSPDNVR